MATSTGGKVMKLTIGQIHDLYLALSALQPDRQQDSKVEPIKLSGDVRMKVAINLNRLREIATAYECSRSSMVSSMWSIQRELAKKRGWKDDTVLPGEDQAHVSAAVSKEDEAMRAVVDRVRVRTFLQADLRLEENHQISGKMIEGIVPVVDDIAADEPIEDEPIGDAPIEALSKHEPGVSHTKASDAA